MQRAVPVLFIALVLLAIAYVFVHAERPAAAPLAAASSSAEAAAGSTGPIASASTTSPEGDAGVAPPSQTELERVLQGGSVPPLPNNAPASVDLAVILFTHQDAQFAGKKARSKSEALRLAKELLPEAVGNFAEAVKKGDPGSTNDAGSVPRGVLEPGLQYVVYTLEKGQVFPEPVDTPRGYWIVKRLR
jgi:hypothetical protein